MRLLELRTNGQGSPSLEFHPNLTVVYGLSASARAQVISALEALPAGVDSGMGGLIEAHGILFDLTAETLDILGLDAAVDVVIHADDLPTRDEDQPMASVTPLFGDSAVPDAPDPVARAAALEELERSRAAVKDAAEAYEVMAEALERARLERAAAIEASQRIQAALDKARRERDIARAQRDGKADETLSASKREAQLRQSLEELELTQAELEEGIREMEERDPRPIQVLVDALNQPQSDRLVPSREALALADDFSELQQQLDELERRLQADGLSMDQLSQRLEDARFEVTQSERGVSKPEATDEDIRELEAAHDEVLEAEKRASGRVGRKAALKRLEEAKVAEQAILDRIGFPTWTSYIMGSSLLNIDPVAEQRLEQARFELQQAEDSWALLTAQLEADPDYAGLLDRLEAVFLAAFDVLGGETDGDLEERLRNHLVPDEEVSRDDIIEALAYQLGLRDVEVEENAPAEVIEGVAEEWLAATSDHWERYRAFQEEHERVANERETTERELEMLGGDPDLDTEEERQRTYESAESRVAEILADLEGVSEIVTELDGQVEAREALLFPSQMAVDVTQAGLAVAEARVEELGGLEPDLPPSYDRNPQVYDDLPYADDGDDDQVEVYLRTRAASLRNRSHAGSVPLVLDDAFQVLSADEIVQVLGHLEEVSESVQVVYLTDDDAVVEWADSVGLQRAAAVTPQGDFG